VPSGDASLEVRSPSALSHSEQRLEFGRTYLIRPPTPSGIHNLLAPSSAPSLPALFHAGSALGDTLQSFLPLALPYVVSDAFPLMALNFRSAFRVLLNARVRHRAQRFRLKSGAWLSWVFLPSGYSLSLRHSDLHRKFPSFSYSPDVTGWPSSNSGFRS